MTQFEAKTLSDLHDAREVSIRTEKHPANAVPIWVVVANDEVFVRSAYGAKGRWYRDLAAGGAATLEFAGRRLPVQAIPEGESAAVEAVSREYLRKYGPGPYSEMMVKPEILPTTLRLDPR
jgi:hypothetical protein